MFDLLRTMLKTRLATQRKLFPQLSPDCLGLPQFDQTENCGGTECSACVAVCPTAAISLAPNDKPVLDLSSCIGCGLCISSCPTSALKKNHRTDTAVRSRAELMLRNDGAEPVRVPNAGRNVLRHSLAVRVVSTGCSACDMEVGAVGNPIFDMERFGIQVVASPRMADALLVTGPVGRGMHEALKRSYEAMADPKVVIACGTCAISGGVHSNGYAEADGVDSVLPVDVYVPGCPPHPWSIIHGLFLAMGRET